MALIVPDSAQAEYGLRALKCVATADGELHPTQRAALDGSQRHFLHTEHALDALPPLSPAGLAERFVEPKLRRQLVQAMCALAMLRGEILPGALATIRSYAQALDIDEPLVNELRLLAEGRLLMFRFDFLRHSFFGDSLRSAIAADGMKGLYRFLSSVAGFNEDAALAARFHKLRELPDDTLGRQFWQFYVDRGFKFPGEKQGTPLPLVGHDVAHLLGGYGTDPPGEMQVLFFQAGFRRDNPLIFPMVAILQAHMGVPTVTFAKPPTSKGLLSEPGLLERCWQAYERGAAMNTDLFESGWDLFSVAEQPLAAVRAGYGIPAQPPQAPAPAQA